MRNNRLIKSTSVLFSGTLIAFSISFLFSIYFRRVLSDELFANYELVFRWSSILAVVLAGRYGMAIVVPKEDQEAKDLFFGANFIAGISACVIFLLIFIVKNDLAEWLNLEKPEYLFFIPIVAFLMTLGQNFNFLFTRLKAFKLQSLFKVFHRVGEGGSNLSFQNLNLGGLLIISDIIGRVAINVYAYIVLVRKFPEYLKHSFDGWLTTLHKYREYPLYNALPALMNTFCLQIPPIIVYQRFGELATSKVGLSYQVLAIPLALISTAVSQVILQRVSQLRGDGKKIDKDIGQLFLLLFGMSLVGLLIIQFFAEDIFAIAFNENNRIAGEYAKILVYSTAIRFIVSPFSTILPALNKIKLGSYWQVFYFCVIISLFIYKDSDINSFLWFLVKIEVVAYLIYMFVIGGAVYKYNKELKVSSNF